MPKSSTWSLSFSFSHQNPVCISILPHVCHIPCPSHFPWIYHPDNIWWGIQLVKVFIWNTLKPSLPSALLCHSVILSTLFLKTQPINPLTPNDHYNGRTAPLTSKRCILYIYSTNIGTEYFKCGIYSLFFPLQNVACSINLTYLVPLLFTFYIQGVLKLKK